MLNTNMWSTFSLILLSLTWIFRPTLAAPETRPGFLKRMDVTFDSGKITPCENYEISVKLRGKRLDRTKAHEKISVGYLRLFYQADSEICKKADKSPLSSTGGEHGNEELRLVFNKDLVFSKVENLKGHHIKAGSLGFKAQGYEVKYTFFKFRPFQNNYDICLTIELCVQSFNFDATDAITFNVSFQQGPFSCKPQKEQCQYKDRFVNDGFKFNETTPKITFICECKKGKVECLQWENPNPIYDDGQPDTTEPNVESDNSEPNEESDNSEPDEESGNSDSIPGTTEAPKEGGMMMVYIVAGVIALAVVGGATYFLFFKKRPAQTNANEGANYGNELQRPNERKGHESLASKGDTQSSASGAESSQMSGSTYTTSGSAETGSS